jgi:uncharacterized membrane protein YhaH (DUF805 family)
MGTFLFYLLVLIVMVVLLASAGSLSDNVENHEFEFGLSVVSVFFLLGIWMNTALSMKRLHDQNLPGWPLILVFGFDYLVPEISWAVGILLIPLYLVRGTAGPNRYGPDPLCPDAELKSSGEGDGGAPQLSVVASAPGNGAEAPPPAAPESVPRPGATTSGDDPRPAGCIKRILVGGLILLLAAAAVGVWWYRSMSPERTPSAIENLPSDERALSCMIFFSVGNKLYRMNPDGRNLEIFSELNHKSELLTVDSINRKIYVSHWDNPSQILVIDLQSKDVRAFDGPPGWGGQGVANDPVTSDIFFGLYYNGVYRKEMNNAETWVQLVSSASLAPLLGQRGQLQIDPTNRQIYFRTAFNGECSCRYIWKVDFSGDHLSKVTPANGGDALALDLNARKIYFSDVPGNGTIMRANMDGSGLETLFQVPAPYQFCRAIALDPANNDMYLSLYDESRDYKARAIARSKMDGTEFRILHETTGRSGDDLSGGIGLLFADASVMNELRVKESFQTAAGGERVSMSASFEDVTAGLAIRLDGSVVRLADLKETTFLQKLPFILGGAGKDEGVELYEGAEAAIVFLWTETARDGNRYENAFRTLLQLPPEIKLGGRSFTNMLALQRSRSRRTIEPGTARKDLVLRRITLRDGTARVELGGELLGIGSLADVWFSFQLDYFWDSYSEIKRVTYFLNGRSFDMGSLTDESGGE